MTGHDRPTLRETCLMTARTATYTVGNAAGETNSPSARPLICLGIESSCDETAAAVVVSDPDARAGEGRPLGRIRAHLVLSQIDEHKGFGGVVPEIAARAHIDHLDRLVAATMAEAGMTLDGLDAIAVTSGPGLIGGVMVGLMTAKGLALGAGVPLIGINHLEAHALTARLTDGVDFPFLLLLVSGGHCLIAEVTGHGRYRRLGATIDDAVGEAFDKTARLLGLGYPGGPAVERAAETGDPARFAFPRPMIGRPDCDFSFSGLKTAIRQEAQRLKVLSHQDVADLAASFQAAVADSIADRVGRAAKAFTTGHGRGRALVVAGGVAANTALRTRLAGVAGAHGLHLVAPPMRLCTDNGAMIAWAGIERLMQGPPDAGQGLDLVARARWPLDPDAEQVAAGGRGRHRG
jgi:N6-L-threonylcarbamoyladenine synthase